jgi:hypothetical protein
MAYKLPITLNDGNIQRLQVLDLVDPVALGTGPATASTYLRGDGVWSPITTPSSSGTVTDVYLATTDGILGSVMVSTTTPIISLGLGNITPTSIVASSTIATGGYTIATLPPGAIGQHAYITDGQDNPAFLGLVSTTGTTVTPVFYNGSAWIYG